MMEPEEEGVETQIEILPDYVMGASRLTLEKSTQEHSSDPLSALSSTSSDSTTRISDCLEFSNTLGTISDIYSSSLSNSSSSS